MKIHLRIVVALILACAAVSDVHLAGTKASPPASATIVMTVTAVGKKDAVPPPINAEDVQVNVGKERKQITDWTKAEKLNLAVLTELERVEILHANQIFLPPTQ
jgi:hypothetical protein